ncbi:MAG: hypothetical protein M9927_26330, partial [Anaerolineae bacterium]|nr:hypothetical protein [Burkholderiaceae bacterium]MCO5247299.1 hypothetical protein [Anaerolineae bacterium]
LDIGAHGTSVMRCAVPRKTDLVWSDTAMVSEAAINGFCSPGPRVGRENPAVSYLPRMLI